MDYIIYSFGGGDTLVAVFNALGRIFASDSQYFTPIGQLALTIGGIWAAMRAMLKGNLGFFTNQYLLPSFLSFVFLFAPKSTVWVKDEASLSAPVKVDNIPFGIAFFASVSSNMSYALSELLEKHLLPLDQGLSSRQNGIMFGAKVVSKLKDAQIQNPVTLSNTKEFMRQCFTKPYVIGNILGKKGAAQQASDIISFIEQNPPNNFGIYYKDPVTGISSFKTCASATALIKTALKQELNDGLINNFATALGMQSDKPERLKAKLKISTEDTLKYLKHHQSDLYNWMSQSMLLNANREAIDDWREKYSLSRIYPELVSMNATRGMFQQSLSYITAGQMAAQLVPVLQSAFMAIIICLVFVVFPMSMLPGGFNILKTWILLIIWVGSWPVFFTIIHCLGMISFASQSAAFNGSGLSILSQGGLAEIALHSYATYQLLAASVPMLAWAVMKGCAHATTSIAGAFTPISAATAIGSASADNNLSLSNINVGNSSLGQQNLSPNLQMGFGVIDDGGIRVTNSDGGGQFITEAVDSLATNFKVSEMYSDSVQTQLGDSQEKIRTLSERSGQLASVETGQTLELAKKVARGEAVASNWSTSEADSIRESLSKGLGINEAYGNRDSKDTSTAANANLGLGFGRVGAGVGVNSSNSKSSSHDMSASEQRAYQDALEKVKNAAKNDGFTESSDDVRSLTSGLRSAWSEQENIGKEIATNKQHIQSLQHQKAYLEQNSATIDRNMNADVLQAVMHKGGFTNKAQAVRWIQSHPQESSSIAKNLANIKNPLPSHGFGNASQSARKLGMITSDLDNHTMGNIDQLHDKHKQASTNVTAASGSLENSVENQLEVTKMQYNKDNAGQILTDNVSGRSARTVQNLQNMRPVADDQAKHLKDNFDNTEKSVISRMGHEVAKHSGTSDQDIQKRNINIKRGEYDE